MSESANSIVPIDQVKFDKEIYPRFEADNATVNQYRESVECLPPILVTKDYVLIDGYHRLLAHKLEGKTQIAVNFFESVDPQQILLESIRLNSIHGKQLSQREKQNNGLKLWELGIKDTDKLASILSVEKRTINRWTEEVRRDENQKRDAEILDLYLQCYSFDEISNKLTISKDTVHRAFDNGQLSEIEHPSDLQFYNVWKVGKLSPDQLKYPGQTPFEIAENIVYYYTEAPQNNPLKISKVVDPMAGSGVIRDVCRKLLRRYVLFDLKPLRQDIPIIENDILKGFPEKANNADLVYFDPPYYNLMEEYPDNEFKKDYSSFLIALNLSLSNIKAILKPQGKVALILKPMNEKMLEGEWLDITFDCVTIAKNQGFKLIKRIAAPLSTQQFNAEDVTRAKDRKIMLNTLRDIVILEVN